MKILKYVILSSFMLLISSLPLFAQAMTAGEIIQKSHLAYYYAGNDGKAKVAMRLISKAGNERRREMIMIRKDEADGRNQKYFTYFHQPADVRGTTYMVYKYPNRDDDRWLFIPSINLVQRIAASDKRSSFFGSDFTYEDVSGRDPGSDNHTLLKEEIYNGKECYVVESVSKGGADYTKKVSWIDKSNFLPLKEEYYNMRGELYRQFTADEVKEIQGFPTITKRTMKNLKSGHRTEVAFQEVKYDIGVSEDLFSERHLRKPPQKWIQ